MSQKQVFVLLITQFTFDFIPKMWISMSWKNSNFFLRSWRNYSYESQSKRCWVSLTNFHNAHGYAKYIFENTAPWEMIHTEILNDSYDSYRVVTIIQNFDQSLRLRRFYLIRTIFLLELLSNPYDKTTDFSSFFVSVQRSKESLVAVDSVLSFMQQKLETLFSNYVPSWSLTTKTITKIKDHPLFFL